jgi:hypothetical protein
MKGVPQRHVVRAERLGSGILIQFDNGEAALYSAALLHSILDQAFVLPLVTSQSRAGAQRESEAIHKSN